MRLVAVIPYALLAVPKRGGKREKEEEREGEREREREEGKNQKKKSGAPLSSCVSFGSLRMACKACDGPAYVRECIMNAVCMHARERQRVSVSVNVCAESMCPQESVHTQARMLVHARMQIYASNASAALLACLKASNSYYYRCLVVTHTPRCLKAAY